MFLNKAQVFSLGIIVGGIMFLIGMEIGGEFVGEIA